MSLIQKELRLRVERVLNGTGQAVDLATLFLSQRDKKCRPSVVEIGDFIAHRDKRERGTIFKQTKAAIMSARAYQARHSKSINWPELVAISTQTSLDAHDEITMKDKMGFGLSNASSMLGRCKSKMFGKLKKLNDKEKKLVQYLLEPPPKMVITSVRLINEFSESLIEGKLMSVDELEYMILNKDLISIFAVSQIHGTKIVLDDGYESNLYAFYNRKSIVIACEIKCINKYFQPFTIMNAICRFEIDDTECLSNDLRREGQWFKTVEIDNNRQLCYT